MRVDELAAGNGCRVGSCYRVEWRSRIPYSIVFDFTVEQVDEPALMEGRAEGDLNGRGRWRLFEDEWRDRRALRVERLDLRASAG